MARPPPRTEDSADGSEAELANSSPYKKGPVHREDFQLSSTAPRLRPSLFFFSHPPRPPGSSPCSSAHGRGWEEFSPAGSRSEGWLKPPEDRPCRARGKCKPLKTRDSGRMLFYGFRSMVRSMVLLVRWFCLCDGFACAMVFLLVFLCYGFLRFLLVCTVSRSVP
jgi:hypothetical protein